MFENFSGKPGPSISPVMFGVEPNITGTATGVRNMERPPEGCFGLTATKYTQIGGGVFTDYGFTFNASSSNSIYESSNTVQPASNLMLACIKI